MSKRASPDEVIRRLKQVASLMIAGKYDSTTPPLLASEWGVGLKMVERIVAEASHWVSAAGKDLRADIERKLDELEEIQRLALAHQRTVMRPDGTTLTLPAPNFHAAVEAARVWLHARGAFVTRRSTEYVEEQSVHATLTLEITQNPEVARAVVKRLGVPELRRLLTAKEETPHDESSTPDL